MKETAVYICCTHYIAPSNKRENLSISAALATKDFITGMENRAQFYVLDKLTKSVQCE